MKILSIFLSITLISCGVLSAQTDAATDALLQQILGDEAVGAKPTAAPAPAPAPKPVAPPTPAPQQRVVIPGTSTQAAPQPEPANSAVMQQIEREIRQSGEVDSLQARIREINGFGEEPSENAPERRPQPSDPPVRRLTNPVPDAPVRSYAEAPGELPMDEGVTPAPEVRDSPSTFASPPTDVPAPPAFQNTSSGEMVADESTPAPTPQAALPTWNEPTDSAEETVASGSRLTAAQQNPYGSPRGVEQPAAEKSGFLGKLFGKKDQPAPRVATVATAMVADPTPEPTTPSPELPKPYPTPQTVAPDAETSNATEIASVGQEPETKGSMILPSARIPAADAKDPERLIESGSTPPLLKPLNLDWLSGSSADVDEIDAEPGNPVTEP